MEGKVLNECPPFRWRTPPRKFPSHSYFDCFLQTGEETFFKIKRSTKMEKVSTRTTQGEREREREREMGGGKRDGTPIGGKYEKERLEKSCNRDWLGHKCFKRECWSTSGVSVCFVLSPYVYDLI